MGGLLPLNRRAWMHGCATATMILWSGSVPRAFAQVAPGQVPSGGAGIDRPALPTRDDLAPVPETPVQNGARLAIVGDVERSPCPLADPKFAGVTVPVNSVMFGGLKGATTDEMLPAWAPYRGTRQPVSVLCEIRDAAATILRRKGYLAAVQVPTQRIENGEIRMEMLYARVTAVRARGQTTGAERMIARYLGRLTEDEVFDRTRAERYLLLARDLPGYNVQLTLKPAGGAPGEVIAEVTVVRRPYAVDATIQNLSSRAVGRWGGQLRAQAFGLTGLGDATSLSIYSTADFDEQQILQAAHEFRLGSEGLRVAGQFTYAWSEPDLGASAARGALKARTLFATLEASYPFVRRQSHNLSVGGGLDLVNQKVNFAAVPLTRDKVRVAFARLSGDAVDLGHATPRWRISGSAELRRGLDILGARDCDDAACAILASRGDGDAQAALFRASGVGEIALGKSLALAVAPRVQIAFDPVLAFEEFSGGNYTIGRGYDPGTVSGDSGFGASVELRGSGLPLDRNDRFVLRPYVFADGARAWSLNDVRRSEDLLSLGGGFRLDLDNRLRLDAMLAVPTTDDLVGPSPRSARFLLTLTTRLLPWSDRR